MRRRKKHFFNPFELGMSMFGAGLRISGLAQSSAEVIASRSEMISRAMNGEAALDHKEFMQMWQEKFIAGGESWLAGMRHLAALRPGSRADQQLQANVDGLMKVMAPYEKKASANAKRLRKAKTRRK